MKAAIIFLFGLVLFVSQGCMLQTSQTQGENTMTAQTKVIELPAPILKGTVSLEETLFKRRSIREFSAAPLSLGEISQLLWAAQGITESWGGRTAPSAGGLYPLEVYVIAGNVDNLPSAVYKYIPDGHKIQLIKEGDIRTDVAKAALNQSWVEDGSAVLAITAVYRRTTQKYGDRGIRYVHMEAGHAAQNICLEATALELGAVTVGAFNDNQVASLLNIKPEETPLYVIPVGKK